MPLTPSHRPGVPECFVLRSSGGQAVAALLSHQPWLPGTPAREVPHLPSESLGLLDETTDTHPGPVTMTPRLARTFCEATRIRTLSGMQFKIAQGGRESCLRAPSTAPALSPETQTALWKHGCWGPHHEAPKSEHCVPGFGGDSVIPTAFAAPSYPLPGKAPFGKWPLGMREHPPFSPGPSQGLES